MIRRRSAARGEGREHWTRRPGIVRSASLALAVVCVATAARAGHNMYCENHPRNDDFANAAEIPFVPFVDAGTMNCATEEPGELAYVCGVDVGPVQSVWYRLRPSETMRLTAHVVGLHECVSCTVTFPGPYRPVVQIYRLEREAPMTQYACGVGEEIQKLPWQAHPVAFRHAEASFLAVEDQTYYIQLHIADDIPNSEGDFLFLLAPKIETDPERILP